MKLEENFLLKSVDELFEELQHRQQTLQSTISEEQDIYICIDYRGEVLSLKHLQIDHGLVFHYRSTSPFEMLRAEIIETSNPLYRNFLVNTLRGVVEIYNEGAYAFTTTQQRQLEGSDCIVEDCRIEEHHLVIVDDSENWQRVPHEKEAKYWDWSEFHREPLEQPKLREEIWPKSMEDEAKEAYEKVKEELQLSDKSDFDSRDEDGIDWENWNDFGPGDWDDPDFTDFNSPYFFLNPKKP